MKKAASFTVDEHNLLWLKGQARATDGTVSGIVDSLVTEARAAGRMRPGAIRSVVGTIDLSDDDPGLERADALIRSTFDRSVNRPTVVKERRSRYPTRRRGRE